MKHTWKFIQINSNAVSSLTSSHFISVTRMHQHLLLNPHKRYRSVIQFSKHGFKCSRDTRRERAKTAESQTLNVLHLILVESVLISRRSWSDLLLKTWHHASFKQHIHKLLKTSLFLTLHRSLHCLFPIFVVHIAAFIHSTWESQ